MKDNDSGCVRLDRTAFGNIKLFCLGVYNRFPIGLLFTLLSTCFIVFSTEAMVLHFFIDPATKWLIFGTILLSALGNMALLLRVAFSDPGFIVPGDVQEGEYSKKSPIAKIKDQNYVLKYCNTCSIVRDLRVFHCRSCGLCVIRHGKTS